MIVKSDTTWARHVSAESDSSENMETAFRQQSVTTKMLESELYLLVQNLPWLTARATLNFPQPPGFARKFLLNHNSHYQCSEVHIAVQCSAVQCSAS